MKMIALMSGEDDDWRWIRCCQYCLWIPHSISQTSGTQPILEKTHKLWHLNKNNEFDCQPNEALNADRPRRRRQFLMNCVQMVPTNSLLLIFAFTSLEISHFSHGFLLQMSFFQHHCITGHFCSNPLKKYHKTPGFLASCRCSVKSTAEVMSPCVATRRAVCSAESGASTAATPRSAVDPSKMQVGLMQDVEV